MSKPTRWMVLFLGAALIAPCLFAEQVPGTSVVLTPPKDFVQSGRFAGFMMTATSASILVNELPAPYEKAGAALDDQARLEAEGMKLLSRSSIGIDGRDAMLFHVEQFLQEVLFKKWVLVVDDHDTTIIISASYPAIKASELEESLKASILGATFEPRGDPVDALSYSVSVIAPFEIAMVMGQTMGLVPGGKFPVTDESVPRMFLGLSPTEDYAVSDQEGLGEQILIQLSESSMRDLADVQTSPVTVGNLSGYATRARGIGTRSATPLIVYVVVLFDSDGYFMLHGVAPAAEENVYVPIFQQTANSFVMKEPSGQ